MGIKRKASAFEGEEGSSPPSYHGNQSSTTSYTLSSPASSTSTIKTSSSDVQPHNNSYDTYNGIKPIPFLSSRTRKRYRDARPEQEIIHENTLKKLYDAQRLHLDEAIILSDASDMQSEHDADLFEDAEMLDQEYDMPDVEIPATVQPNQRTIEAFFGGRE